MPLGNGGFTLVLFLSTLTDAHPPERGVQICWRFQRPLLNNTTPAAAIAASAITIERKTPFERIFNGMASAYARGISSSQKPKKLTMVGVTVSPAPLNACSMTMP